MKEINEYKAEQIQGQYIRLNANESNSIFSKGEIIDMLLSLQLDNFNRYPDTSTKELRKAYGKFIGYSYRNILAGNGSDQLIGVVISSYINKGDKILTLQPDFSMYDFYASLNEGQLVKLDIGKKGKFAVKDLIALGKKESPKMIIFSNPNNPTGYELSVEEIEELLSNFSNIKILVDEAYIEFGGESALNLIEKYENLYITRTMSKAWGIAALRIGFVISNEKNIKELESFMVPYSINSISQEIAIKILSYKEEIFENIEIIKSQGVNISKAKICGGGTKNRLWLKLIATILNVQLEIPSFEDAGALGACLLAAKGNGNNVSDNFYSIKETIIPDKTFTQFYENKYNEYLKLYRMTNSISQTRR